MSHFHTSVSQNGPEEEAELTLSCPAVASRSQPDSSAYQASETFPTISM